MKATCGKSSLHRSRADLIFGHIRALKITAPGLVLPRPGQENELPPRRLGNPVMQISRAFPTIMDSPDLIRVAEEID